MQLKEALFLSSLNKAVYNVPSSNDQHYRVQVELIEEEYTPLINLYPDTKQYADAFEITVCRVVGEEVYAPHHTNKQYGLAACLEYLENWGVGADYLEPWHPVEQWDKQEDGKQDIA